MGVGRIFFQGGISERFEGKPRFLLVEAKNGEITFFPLEDMKTTLFAKKINRKMSNFKILGGAKNLFCLPSDAHGCVWCKCWRIHIMADIYLRFKLHMEVGAN